MPEFDFERAIIENAGKTVPLVWHDPDGNKHLMGEAVLNADGTVDSNLNARGAAMFAAGS